MAHDRTDGSDSTLCVTHFTIRRQLRQQLSIHCWVHVRHRTRGRRRRRQILLLVFLFGQRIGVVVGLTLTRAIKCHWISVHVHVQARIGCHIDHGLLVFGVHGMILHLIM